MKQPKQPPKGRLPGFSLVDGDGLTPKTFLRVLGPRPDNPQAYDCALKLYTPPGFRECGDRYMDGANILAGRVLKGDTDFAGDVAKYISILRKKWEVPGMEGDFFPLDQIGFWMLCQYDLNGDEWKPRWTELAELSAETWDGGLSESTIKRRCKQLGLPLDNSKGRPKKK